MDKGPKKISRSLAPYIIAITITILVIIIVVSVLFVRFDTTITMSQFEGDYSCGSKGFQSYEPGDSVEFVDKIAIIMTEFEYHGNYEANSGTFNGTNYENLLYIWFDTGGSLNGFTFGAEEWSTISNFRNSTHAGDTITLDIQIVEAIYSGGQEGEWFVGHIHGHPDIEIISCMPWVPMPPMP